MISHHHKCIFVHIPKCGGQSIETAFLNDIGLDWSCRAPLLLMYNNQPNAGPPRLAHLTAYDYIRKGYVPKAVFDAYFSFAMVRNPWHRVVSLYFYLGRNYSFRGFVVNKLRSELWTDMYWFVRPQVEFLADPQGHQLVDKIYTLEQIRFAFEKVRKICGLGQQLQHVNRGGYDQTDWRAFYDDETREVVEYLYYKDIEKLGYRFEGQR